MALDLESIIRDVQRYATSNIGGRGQTAAQGRALLGIGELAGGLQQSQDKLASAEKLGIMGMQNEIDQQKIASSPGMMEQERKNRVPGLGLLAPKPSDTPTSPSDWFKSNPMFSKWYYE